jgi:hypothetical protein
MENLIGKIIVISGMTIEVISEDEERYECRNMTTKDTVFMKKPVIENAIKLGKAEVLTSLDDIQ